MNKESIEAWLARDKNNSLCLYTCKPKKLKNTSAWLPQHRQMHENGVLDDYIFLDEILFPSVKWEDDEPTRVHIIIS